MKSYIPIYKRSPNKFLYYKFEDFDDGYGHIAVLRIAVFTSNGKEQEYIVQVM